MTRRTVKVQGASRLGFWSIKRRAGRAIGLAAQAIADRESLSLVAAAVFDLGSEGGDRLVERHHLLLLGAKPAYRNRAVFQLALAHRELHRDLGDAVLADLVGDLLIAKICTLLAARLQAALQISVAYSSASEVIVRTLTCVAPATAASCRRGARSGCP